MGQGLRSECRSGEHSSMQYTYKVIPHVTNHITTAAAASLFSTQSLFYRPPNMHLPSLLRGSLQVAVHRRKISAPQLRMPLNHVRIDTLRRFCHRQGASRRTRYLRGQAHVLPRHRCANQPTPLDQKKHCCERTFSISAVANPPS